jgi:hypothetical protein
MQLGRSYVAGGVLDFSADYALIDDRIGDTVIVLDRNFAFVVDKWTLRDPDTGDALAEIVTRNKLIELLRSIHAIFSLLPHADDSTTPDGRSVGSIEGKFSLRDAYEASIDDPDSVPREAVVAAAMVVDAIEGN